MQLICTAKSNVASLADFRSAQVIDIGDSGPGSGSSGQPFRLRFRAEGGGRDVVASLRRRLQLRRPPGIPVRPEECRIPGPDAETPAAAT